jgi:hypothetical protein
MEKGSSDRQERAARNQNLFREVNERVEEVAQRFDPTFTSFACECADTKCMEQVSLTFEEYERVRRSPNHFIVKAGHVLPDVERVVGHAGADGTRYEVVEKFGKSGEIARELDPRRGTSS